MNQVILLVLLVVLSFQDLKSRQIVEAVPVVGIFVGTGIRLFSAVVGNANWIQCVISFFSAMIPGILCYLLVLVTRQIGCGDALVLLMTGILSGLENCVLCICISLFAMAIYSVALLMVGRANRRTKLPYLPFLLLACLVVFIR